MASHGGRLRISSPVTLAAPSPPSITRYPPRNRPSRVSEYWWLCRAARDAISSCAGGNAVHNAPLGITARSALEQQPRRECRLGDGAEAAVSEPLRAIVALVHPHGC